MKKICLSHWFLVVVSSRDNLLGFAWPFLVLDGLKDETSLERPLSLLLSRMISAQSADQSLKQMTTQISVVGGQGVGIYHLKALLGKFVTVDQSRQFPSDSNDFSHQSSLALRTKNVPVHKDFHDDATMWTFWTAFIIDLIENRMVPFPKALVRSNW